ncbi:hypothetical protein HanPI659440_Chr09g0321531 [Helianthus annuus]|nr:hypothetical protein HanPI659440_Chr09g0321531 [Helianthus annuus]
MAVVFAGVRRMTRSVTGRLANKRKQNGKEKDEEWDEEDEESAGNVVGRVRKRAKKDNWPGIRTRSSPIQLARCINVLSLEQRIIVKRMGFGRLLKFKVDGLPAKLANYVVERFNPLDMEINLSCGKIKVDAKAIHKLIGIPRGGVHLSSLPKVEPKDEAVTKWRDRFSGRYVPPTKMVDMIETSDGEDSFNFRMDFLMCFVTLMIDCHKQGCLRPWILDHIMSDMDFSKIDWCQFVLEKLKKCKNGWKSNDSNRPFTGALTILVLLYVDRVRCEGMDVDYSIYPVTFWTKQKLKQRQLLEIRKGAFGTGKLKAQTVCEKFG